MRAFANKIQRNYCINTLVRTIKKIQKYVRISEAKKGNGPKF